MRSRTILFLLLIVGVCAVLFKKKSVAMFNYLKVIFDRFETYSQKPYWDVSRWSWGYGTRVPDSVDDHTKNPGGTISKVQALIDAYAHVKNDEKVILPVVKIPLNDKQKAALLSFSYNLGTGNALKIIPLINEKDFEGLGYKMKSFNKAKVNGVLTVLPGLTLRRAYEYDLFMNQI